MNCSKCDDILKGKFCTSCGAKNDAINKTEAESALEQQIASTQESYQSTQDLEISEANNEVLQKKMPPVKWLFAGGALVIFLIIVAVAIFSRSPDESDDYLYAYEEDVIDEPIEVTEEPAEAIAEEHDVPEEVEVEEESQASTLTFESAVLQSIADEFLADWDGLGSGSVIYNDISDITSNTALLNVFEDTVSESFVLRAFFVTAPTVHGLEIHHHSTFELTYVFAKLNDDVMDCRNLVEAEFFYSGHPFLGQYLRTDVPRVFYTTYMMGYLRENCAVDNLRSITIMADGYLVHISGAGRIFNTQADDYDTIDILGLVVSYVSDFINHNPERVFVNTAENNNDITRVSTWRGIVHGTGTVFRNQGGTQRTQWRETLAYQGVCNCNAFTVTVDFPLNAWFEEGCTWVMTETPILETIVPCVFGESERDAEARLLRAGLRRGSVSQDFHDSVPLGHVISTYPEVGTRMSAGNPVEIVVSIGAPTIGGIQGIMDGDFTGAVGLYTSGFGFGIRVHADGSISVYGVRGDYTGTHDRISDVSFNEDFGSIAWRISTGQTMHLFLPGTIIPSPFPEERVELPRLILHTETTIGGEVFFRE